MKSDDTRQIYERAFKGHGHDFIDDHFELVEAMNLCMVAHFDEWRRNCAAMYALHHFRMLKLIERTFYDVPVYLKSATLLHDIFESNITPEQVKDTGISQQAVDIAVELTSPDINIAEIRLRTKTKESMLQETDRVKLEHLLDRAKNMSNGARFVQCFDRIDGLADGFVNFSQPTMWNYTDESIKLWRALHSGILDDELESLTMSAVAYLRHTINAVIQTGQEQNYDKFEELCIL